jgi:hypothetical protein
MAGCNWALDRSYKVYCMLDGSPSVWVQAYCDIGFHCKQLAFVKSWKGSYGFDVACVPSKSLVKWAIGSRQSGRSYTQYCSSKNTYNTIRTKTATYKIVMNFWGELGLQTQILYGKILLNGKKLMEGFNTNQWRSLPHSPLRALFNTAV